MKFAAFKEHGSEAAVKHPEVIGSKARTILWRTGTSSSSSSMLALVSRLGRRKRRRSKKGKLKIVTPKYGLFPDEGKYFPYCHHLNNASQSISCDIRIMT